MTTDNGACQTPMDIVDDLKLVAAAPNMHGPVAGWCGLAAAEITTLRKELAEARAENERFRKAAETYVASVNGEPEKDCWDTEDGKPAEGAERFASDWAWKEYDDRKQKAFDELRAHLESEGAGHEQA